ncbi:cupin domain-containing protein [Guyparkeria sp.]|uniref:cupin domain-containing protein n=1 Tax=Guyparkeria sp. TaxID=2035736 RepID=UPI003970B984
MAKRRRSEPDRSSYLNHRSHVEPITAPDGSAVRELLHPCRQAIERMSVAEATVEPGRSTRLHRHPIAEEIYQILDGAGLLELGDEHLAVVPGDTIRIAPGQPHRIEARSDAPLRLLCICQPAYSDEDTEFLDIPNLRDGST